MLSSTGWTSFNLDALRGKIGIMLTNGDADRWLVKVTVSFLSWVSSDSPALSNLDDLRDRVAIALTNGDSDRCLDLTTGTASKLSSTALSTLFIARLSVDGALSSWTTAVVFASIPTNSFSCELNSNFDSKSSATTAIVSVALSPRTPSLGSMAPSFVSLSSTVSSLSPFVMVGWSCSTFVLLSSASSILRSSSIRESAVTGSCSASDFFPVIFPSNLAIRSFTVKPLWYVNAPPLSQRSIRAPPLSPFCSPSLVCSTWRCFVVSTFSVRFSNFFFPCLFQSQLSSSSSYSFSLRWVVVSGRFTSFVSCLKSQRR